jgi:adenylate kinase family enzyme
MDIKNMDALHRIVVVGGSCSGKTTFSKSLAQVLDSEHVELDSLHWEPGWRECSMDVFRGRVQDALKPRKWVVDGNYSKVNDLIWSKADAVVWLDLPLVTILRRFFVRSISRWYTKEALWNGNREGLRNSIFQRNSLLMWILKTHRRRRRQYLEYLQKSPFPNLRIYRLRSENDITAFIQKLKK